MSKILFVDPEKCTGCNICETVCSLHHEGVYNPSSARIHVVKWENAGLFIPMVCQQCDPPVCEIVCPVRAIHKDTETGALLIEESCVNCKLCVMFCPLGGVGINKKGKVIKCDLCGGDPLCVKFCKTEALQYIEASAVNLLKKRAAAEKFSEQMKKILAITQ